MWRQRAFQRSCSFKIVEEGEPGGKDSGTLQLSSFLEARLLPVVTQVGVGFVWKSLRTPPRVDLGGGLTAQVPEVFGGTGHGLHPVTADPV